METDILLHLNIILINWSVCVRVCAYVCVICAGVYLCACKLSSSSWRLFEYCFATGRYQVLSRYCVKSVIFTRAVTALLL